MSRRPRSIPPDEMSLSEARLEPVVCVGFWELITSPPTARRTSPAPPSDFGCRWTRVAVSLLSVSLSVVSAASCRHPSLPRLAVFQPLPTPSRTPTLSPRIPSSPRNRRCLLVKARGYGNRRGNAGGRPALFPIAAVIAASD